MNEHELDLRVDACLRARFAPPSAAHLVRLLPAAARTGPRRRTWIVFALAAGLLATAGSALWLVGLDTPLAERLEAAGADARSVDSGRLQTDSESDWLRARIASMLLACTAPADAPPSLVEVLGAPVIDSAPFDGCVLVTIDGERALVWIADATRDPRPAGVHARCGDSFERLEFEGRVLYVDGPLGSAERLQRALASAAGGMAR